MGIINMVTHKIGKSEGVMNKKVVILVVLMGTVLTLFLKSNNKSEEISKTNQKNKLLTMNLEQTAGSGDYKTVTQSEWPTDGYKFNTELSRCENGSTLNWDDTKKAVIMQGNISDKCYVYFDIASTMTIAEYVISQYTGVQGENNIYYHDSSLENGASDNSYRYAGSSDATNNFVCFGTNESPCPEDNLYRIIGVFDENNHGNAGKHLVKLIKYTKANNELLGTDGAYYSSDYKWTNLETCPNQLAYSSNSIIQLANKNIIAAPNPNYGTCTDWQYSDLNTINLNNNFINNIGETWTKFIINNNWYTSNISSRSLTVKEIHQEEIKDGSKKYSSKIGLIYVSDYGFSSTPDIWTTNMVSYPCDTEKCWLNTSKYTEWTITVLDSDVLTIYMSSGLSNVSGVTNYYSVRPTFYLNSDVTYKSGTGTSSDPIIIGD